MIYVRRTRTGVEICDKDTWIPVPHGGIRPLIDALRAECIERYPIANEKN